MGSRLIGIHGPLSDWTIYLDKPIISIGRNLSNDIVIPDPCVSRHHCLIRNDNGRCLIEDLNSANGLYINMKRVAASALKDASFVQIGNSCFMFWLREVEGWLSIRRTPIEL